MFALNKIKKKKEEKAGPIKHKQTKTNHKERNRASRENKPILKVILATITTDIYNEKRNLSPVVRTFTWP